MVGGWIRRYWRPWYVVTMLAFAWWLKPQSGSDYVAVALIPVILATLCLMVALLFFFAFFALWAVVNALHVITGKLAEWLNKIADEVF